MLGESQRKEQVWDSGSDHSVELAELDSTLTDLVGQLGTGPFKAGTPQRAKLDQKDSRACCSAGGAVEGRDRGGGL